MDITVQRSVDFAYGNPQKMSNKVSVDFFLLFLGEGSYEHTRGGGNVHCGRFGYGISR